jgi:hypothetical protein
VPTSQPPISGATAAAFLALECGVEQREAIGKQESGTDSLCGAGGEQDRQARRECTEQRRNPENPGADDQQAPASEMVAKRAAKK